MSPHDEEVLIEVANTLAKAITKISHGDVSGPSGFEGLAMAIAGSGLSHSLSDAITDSGQQIFEGLSDVAASIRILAEAIQSRTEPEIDK